MVFYFCHMQQTLLPYHILLKRLLLIFALYTLCRACFLFFNLSSFSNTGAADLFQLFFYGLRFDLYAIFITNALFILLHIIPLPFFFQPSYQRLLKFLFYFVNVPCLLLNAIDFIYFRFSQKRSTADFFSLLTMGEDVRNNIGQYILDFWYVLLLVIMLIVATEYLYRRIKVAAIKRSSKNYILQTIALIPSIAMLIIGGRGGLQYRPINMQTAARYASPQLIPLVLNTPFTIIKTLGKEELADIKYMSNPEAEKLFNIHKELKPAEPFKPSNVIIIVLESFSKEYIGYFNNGKGYTPFLDSLITKSFVCANAFANAKRSIEGVPAVVASLPSLMEESFITSGYNANKINSLASLLKSKGYQSAFFHGGNNGTMGFDNFCRLAGFDQYFGRNEYKGDQKDYDGNWGIFDEPYYHYCVKKFSEMRQPFVTTIFSLSSHHPYTIPAKYKNKFPKGSLPIEESIGYADYSLRKFFEEAKTKEWFGNTLFVITADHTGPAEAEQYRTRTGIYEIPIIYYCQKDSLTGNSDHATQQCDILPSVLDYLHYSGNYSAFGNSVFSANDHFAINYMSNAYQLINDDYVLQFDGEAVTGLCDYHRDFNLTMNLTAEKKTTAAEMEKKLKAIIQQYQQGMLHNTLVKK